MALKALIDKRPIIQKILWFSSSLCVMPYGNVLTAAPNLAIGQRLPIPALPLVGELKAPSIL